MDPLEADDRQRALATPPGEKLRQACDLMALALRMMRRNLRRRHPDDSEAELEARYQQWLLSDDR